MPQVREYFRNNMLHWVRDVGVDGFRADVAGGVPTSFWNEARDAMDKVNPDVIMLAEADQPDHQLKAYDISYNFPYYTALTSVVVNGESAERIRQQWEKARAAFPRGARFLHLNDNHDRNRAAVVFGEKAALATSVLDFTLDGIPFLYNGEEVGDTTAPQQQSHVAIRWDIWKPEGQRRTSTAGQQNAKLRVYKQIFQMRREETALTAGDLTWINNSNADGVVSFTRKKGNDEILVLVNLTNRITKVQVDVPASDFAQARDLLKGRTVPASLSPDKFSCQLGAFDYVVAKRTLAKIGCRSAGAALALMLCVPAAAPAQDARERLLAQADSAYRSLHASEAVSLYRQYLALYPDRADVRVFLGGALLNLNQLHAAFEEAKRAIALDRAYAKGYILAGRVCAAREQWDRAQTLFETAQRLNKRDVDAWYFSGGAFFDANRFEDAIAAFEQALRVGGERSRVYEKLALAHDALGQFSAAEKSFLRAVELAGGAWSAYVAYGAFLFRQSRPVESIRVLQQGFAVAPGRGRRSLRTRPRPVSRESPDGGRAGARGRTGFERVPCPQSAGADLLGAGRERRSGCRGQGGRALQTGPGEPLNTYFVRVRASSRIRLPRAGLKTPHEQNRVRYD